MSATYFLTVRPHVELVEISDPARAMLWASGGGDSVWRPGLAEPDAFSVLASLASEAFRVVREWPRTHGRASTLCLWLSTGGILVYCLYRHHQPRSTADLPGPDRGVGPPGPPPSWWRWLGQAPVRDGLNDVLARGDDDPHGLVPGRYFGPAPGPAAGSGRLVAHLADGPAASRRPSRSLSLSGRPDRPDLAPCPNCLRGICRVKRHRHMQQQIHPDQASSTSSSSQNSSPLHPHVAATLGLRSRWPPTSTPESADDELSDEECAKLFAPHPSATVASADPHTPLRGIPARPLTGTRLFEEASSAHPRRHPPDGRDRWSLSPVALPPHGPSSTSGLHPLTAVYFRPLERDETLESIKSVSGSMVDLVQGAREIRKMIREASMDSLATDYSLELTDRHDLSSGLNPDPNQWDIHELRDSAINPGFDYFSSDVCSFKSSKSEQSMVSLAASLPEPADRRRDASSVDPSTPDLRLLQKPKRRLWKLTSSLSNYNTQADLDSPLQSANPGYSSGLATDPESLEWESPSRGWHDLKHAKYKLALSSHSASECGGDEDFGSLTDTWEWDCEDLGAENGMGQSDIVMDRFSMLNHQNWLPENTDTLELDLETELSSRGGLYTYPPSRSSANTSSANSRRASFDRSSFFTRGRQPPSGRSSVDHGSGDTPKQSIDHDALVKAFGVYPDPMGQSTTSGVSEESGYQEMSPSLATSSPCSFGGQPCSSILTLSPVHEAKEPNTSCGPTPVRQPPLKSKAHLVHWLSQGRDASRPSVVTTLQNENEPEETISRCILDA